MSEPSQNLYAHHLKIKPMIPKEARAMAGYDPEKSVKPWRKAKLTRECKGKYFAWKVGQKVLARHDVGSSYTIQRDPWRGSVVPLANVLAYVPRGALKFL